MSLHAGSAAELSGSVGSPLYRMLPDHLPGVIAVALVPAAVWVLSRSRSRLGIGYRGLPAHLRLLCWLLLTTAAVHLGLILGGHRPALQLVFVLDSAALLAVTRRLLLGGRWRRPAAALLAASILAYAVVSVQSEAPDQVGMATKLVEIAALAIVLRPRRSTRLRQALASTATVTLVVLTGLAGWLGAYKATERGGSEGHDGRAALPGSIMSARPGQVPTSAERAAADRFHQLAVAALLGYRDPAAAARDGYHVAGIVGSEFHADNPAYAKDGRNFDPARPESLVYAQTKRGPVLLGAAYQMPSTKLTGPRIGGPLTDWHGHENVCMSLVPPVLSGLVSPFGGCAVGSIVIPITPEVIHLWLFPGPPSPWGELDEKLRARYLASFER